MPQKFLRTAILAALIFSFPSAFAAQKARPARRAPSTEFQNPIFAYTHLLPNPLTLPAGRLVLGTDAAYGITDSLQIGTGILRDFYQIYNANLKVNFVDYPDVAIGASIAWENYNYHDISSSNPDLRITSWQPGLVLGYEVLPSFAWFVGGNLNFSSETLVTEGVEKSGFVHGAAGEWDMAYAYNPPDKRGGVGNVLTTGVTYDFNYKIYGVGISHYWRGFRIGIHYYPNADQNRILPIVAGGAVVDF